MTPAVSKAICPSCGQDARLLGKIPLSNLFAGQLLDKPLLEGSLYRCKKCFLGFRSPTLNKQELDALYMRGGEMTWADPNFYRKDWSIAEEMIFELLGVGKSILDIGCFDGGFLEKFKGLYKTYGIEIHENAIERAALRGINIIGKDFSDIKGKFDFITSFDVIEHVQKPAEFLGSCAKALNPGGYILISSGNLDSITFNLLKGRYWYSAIPEHLSFISARWILSVESLSDFKVVTIFKFSHDKKKFLGYLKQSILNWIYWVCPDLIGYFRKLGLGNVNIKTYPYMASYPPYWGGSKDHLLVLLKRL
jgi:2-polyprenyl-3-methyl-5-hydroxy-6-metoxy-1,4-benzoquinol methylase